MSANPKSQASLQLEKKLNRKVQGSSTSDRAHQQDYDEKIRRDDEQAETVAVATPRFIAAPSAPAQVIPPAAGIDRWHKKANRYITVSNTDTVSGDPVPDASAFRTITDAINYGMSIYASLRLIWTDPIIEIEVHGGEYLELITIDVNYFRIVGIGMPILSAVNDPDININPVITLTANCTRFYMHGFEVINLGGEGYNWYDNAGLTVADGAESGNEFSDIRISHCYFHGNATQLYAQRWIYVEDSKFYSDNGIGNIWGFSSVVCRFPAITPQTHWSVFKNCLIGAMHGTDYRERAMALTILAIHEDGVTWFANAVTGGTAFAKSGVYLDGCTIDGWSENYGWNLEYHNTYGIQGKFINGTSGSVHNFTYSNSDQGVDAFTWFNHSRVASRYVAQPVDVSVAGTGGTAHIYISHFKHTAPDVSTPPTVQAGAAVHNTVAPIATALVYVDGSSCNTHAKTWYDIGAGEIANILPDAAGAVYTYTDPGGTNQAWYRQGYQNH